MSNLLFSVFPNENFVDIGLYQYGWEQCEPSHSFGPAARNHYIFHYVISGTGTLMADDSSGFFIQMTFHEHLINIVIRVPFTRLMNGICTFSQCHCSYTIVL